MVCSELTPLRFKMQGKVVESVLLTFLIKRNISFYWLLTPSGVISKRIQITIFLRLFAESGRINYLDPIIYLGLSQSVHRIGSPVLQHF